MNTPQPGILRSDQATYNYLEFSVLPNVSATLLRAALTQALADDVAEGHIVCAFGARAWKMINTAWQPPQLVDFKAMTGSGFHCPSTQADIFIWVMGENQSANFDRAYRIQQAMAAVAAVALDLPGFLYHDSRDLMGFVDGTANPKGDAVLPEACIAAGDLGAGGCYVLSQKWVHQLSKFKHLDVSRQERVIGRTKAEDIELEGEAMPHDSHVSRTDAKVDGTAQKIYRCSAPFGNASENGLYFLAFSCELTRFQVQLDRMYGLTEDGVSDQLLNYSSPVTSSYWFSPSEQDLQLCLNHG